ncbi:glutamate receptor ionotropic, delta-1 [Macrosteles quadrilineatus]|uniref:glutamate receptor ionotropic, delta-1 n=1 Tax=Macrosteles quadrilineatus TaxID=74068 RepID=UPI0023E1A6D7|nr:glutamate receptor ionotropic, delta-1 [Macrosteles quadrilineatus]
MERGLVNILLASLCANYPPSYYNSTTTTTPYPTYTRSPRDTFKCVLKTDEQLKKELLRGKKLKIATLQRDMPLSGVKMNGTELQLDGIAAEMVEVLKEKFGFSYEVLTPERNILGDEHEGIFSMLNKGEVDMAAAFLPVVPGSHRMVLWGVEMVQNDYYVLMKRPKESASGSGLLAPFDTEVWLLILLSLLVVGPIMYLVMYLRVRIGDNKDIKVYPLSACVWFVYGALMKQGSTLNPVTDSTRLLFATWWIFIMILTAFYTANLTAFLTLSRFTLPIENVADIARTHRFWFATEGGPIEYAVMNNDDGDLSTLRRSVSQNLGQFIDTSDEVKVKQYVAEDWLYLEENRKLKLFLLQDYMAKTAKGTEEKDRCTYVLTQGSYLSRNLAFAYPKTSILPSLFDPILLAFVESGIIQHRVQELLPEATICPLNLGSKERQLRNSDLWTTYIVVVSGFSTAVTVFFVELMWRRCFKPHHPKLSWPVDISMEPTNKMALSRFAEGKSKQGAKVNINGREYYIVISKDGEKRFIPIRTPSAFLFQYAPK